MAAVGMEGECLVRGTQKKNSVHGSVDIRLDLGQPMIEAPKDEGIANASDHEGLVADQFCTLELYRIVRRRDEFAPGDAHRSIIDRRVLGMRQVESARTFLVQIRMRV